MKPAKRTWQQRYDSALLVSISLSPPLSTPPGSSPSRASRCPTRPPSPRLPAGTTQLTPFPSAAAAAEGNYPTIVPPSFLASRTRVSAHLSLLPSLPFRAPPPHHHHHTIASTMPLSRARGIYRQLVCPHFPAHGDDFYDGASRPYRFAEEREREKERRTCRARVKKVPLWKKNISLSLPLAVSCIHRTRRTLRIFRLSPLPSSFVRLHHGTPFSLPLAVPSRCVPRSSPSPPSHSFSLLVFLLLLSRIFFFRDLLPFCFCPSRGRDEQCNVIQVQE